MIARYPLGAALLSAAMVGAVQPSYAQLDGPPPWQRTETRDDCVDFDALRTPLFGETHVHTTYSFDAISGDVRSGPRDAYDFAKGMPIDLPPYDGGGVAQRSAQLRRRIDFAAVTDHAETIGEVQICQDPAHLPEYNDQVCVDFRAAIPQMSQTAGPGIVAFGSLSVPSNPVRFAFCGVDGTICTDRASLVWVDTQDAADEHYDRSDACDFTTFVSYEWTGNPGVQNIHRNVIFRNETVPSLPTSYIDEPTPEGLHAALTTGCFDAPGQCDVLIIPHNSNLSNGIMFEPENLGDGSPLTAEQAASRAAMEPIVEITQHKGDSECHPGLTTDELCGFEKWTYGYIGLPLQNLEPLQFTRNALMEGLSQEEALGVNPFMFGLIGATDAHTATPGLTNEEDYASSGALGTRDATPELMVEGLATGVTGGIETNPGGLAVVYAEENSRDALFAAMRRREVYGTSGTRPLVRFYGGDYKSDLCDSPEFIETGYRDGVPMGGEIGAVRGKKSPTFAVMATKDPGGNGDPSTPLQRLQIVKGWVDDMGATQEQVYEVAGDPDNGASVDTDTCVTSGTGFDTLCAVWEDPNFDPGQRAFYHARVIENPVCRWSTHLCNSQGIDCEIPATIPAGMENCCTYGAPLTVQERAWSSPIWYRPESFGKFKATVKVKGGSQDTLKIKGSLQEVPAELDPNTEDVTVTVTDDDTIYTATIPAGTMTEKKAGAVWVLSDSTGATDGIKKATLKITSKGEGKVSLKTIKTDLSNADLTDHFVQTTLTASTYVAQHSRLWAAKGITLKP